MPLVSHFSPLKESTSILQPSGPFFQTTTLLKIIMQEKETKKEKENKKQKKEKRKQKRKKEEKGNKKQREKNKKRTKKQEQDKENRRREEKYFDHTEYSKTGMVIDRRDGIYNMTSTSHANVISIVANDHKVKKLEEAVAQLKNQLKRNGNSSK
uniref:Uncharacterized protein n=1 Tax=Romanomermis culicivorax TaxID=13658 RepID=A0A915J0K7_ROMCU